jgi:phosphatidylglycerol---prolipoprotein diacylglyceryl transferase
MYPVLHIFSFNVASFIVIYCAAFVLGAFLLRHEFKRNHYPRKTYVPLIIIGLLSGLLGSKIYYCIEIWNEYLLSPFRSFFTLNGSGWYGGFILALGAIAITLSIMKLPVMKSLDIIAPVIPICQILGRFGCFLGGCCHGVPSKAPWAMSFPDGAYSPYTKVHPTQLYEMMVYLCIALVLWNLRKKKVKNGLLFGLYLCMAGVGRFIVEFYRFNPRIALHLSAPQIAALSGIILGTFIIFHKTKAAHEPIDIRKR